MKSIFNQFTSFSASTSFVVSTSNRVFIIAFGIILFTFLILFPAAAGAADLPAAAQDLPSAAEMSQTSLLESYKNSVSKDLVVQHFLSMTTNLPSVYLPLWTTVKAIVTRVSWPVTEGDSFGEIYVELIFPMTPWGYLASSYLYIREDMDNRCTQLQVDASGEMKLIFYEGSMIVKIVNSNMEFLPKHAQEITESHEVVGTILVEGSISEGGTGGFSLESRLDAQGLQGLYFPTPESCCRFIGMTFYLVFPAENKVERD